MKVIMGHRGTGKEKPSFPYLATRKEEPKTIYLVHYHGAIVVQAEAKNEQWKGDSLNWSLSELKYRMAEYIPLPTGTQLILECAPIDKKQQTYLDEMMAMYERPMTAATPSPMALGQATTRGANPVQWVNYAVNPVTQTIAVANNPVPEQLLQPMEAYPVFNEAAEDFAVDIADEMEMLLDDPDEQN